MFLLQSTFIAVVLFHSSVKQKVNETLLLKKVSLIKLNWPGIFINKVKSLGQSVSVLII